MFPLSIKFRNFADRHSDINLKIKIDEKDKIYFCYRRRYVFIR